MTKAKKEPFGVTADRGKPATEAQVRALEERLGEPLPADYREFLKTINGGRRPGGGWTLDDETDVDRFLGLRDGQSVPRAGRRCCGCCSNARRCRRGRR